MHTTASIRRYYEQNSRLFLLAGRGPQTFVIHRSLWPRSAMTLEQALHQSSELIRAEIETLVVRDALASLHLLDLGCGAGGTLFYLAARLSRPAFLLGVTLSGRQAKQARSSAAELHLNSCLFVEADFQALPLADCATGAGFDVIFSIEAFIHATEPATYLYEAARSLRPGGRLILCDDFLARADMSSDARRLVQIYQSGWFAPNLLAPAHVVSLAQSVGLILVKNRSLTHDLRLIVAPRVITLVLDWLVRWLPWDHALAPSMVGSIALQQCLHAGLIDYRLLVFEKAQARQ